MKILSALITAIFISLPILTIIIADLLVIYIESEIVSLIVSAIFVVFVLILLIGYKK